MSFQYLFSWLCLLVTLAVESRSCCTLASEPSGGGANPFLMVQLKPYGGFLKWRAPTNGWEP